MEHHFCTQIAKEYGIEEAILLHNFFYWLSKNAANEKHFHDGLYWFYNSKKALVDLFPYMNETKIFRSIKNLEERGLVVKGDYNTDKWDRTKWYAITKKGLEYMQSMGYSLDSFSALWQNDTIECVKMNNGACQNEQSILINNTDTNTDSDKKEKKIIKEKKKRCANSYDDNFEEAFKATGRKGSKKNAYNRWLKLSEDDKIKAIKHIPFYYSSNDRQYLKDFEGYLNGRYFDNVVYDKNGNLMYDPERESSNDYTPVTGVDLRWNDNRQCYMFVGMFYGSLYDGYDNNNRPDGATVLLNNGQGTIIWSAKDKKWNKK